MRACQTCGWLDDVCVGVDDYHDYWELQCVYPEKGPESWGDGKRRGFTYNCPQWQGFCDLEFYS